MHNIKKGFQNLSRGVRDIKVKDTAKGFGSSIIGG